MEYNSLSAKITARAVNAAIANGSPVVTEMRAPQRIAEWEIVDHGVDHAQHFQGCGSCGTRFDECYTGVGDNAKEAYEDALERVYSSGTYDGDCLPRHPRGIRKSDSVGAYLQACGETGERAEDSELYAYVSIWVRGL